MGKIKLPLRQAESLANRIAAALEPGCERVRVAGSIRRQKELVGDIEIVCIPRLDFDLLGTPAIPVLDRVLHDLVSAGRLIPRDKNGRNFKNFSIPAMPELGLDLFITTPAQWGVIFTLRTGSEVFSKRLVTHQCYKGGLLPNDMQVAGGRLWRGELVLETPEEMDVFNEIGGRGWWVPPDERG